MKESIYKVETISELHSIAGLDKPRHPFVTILDYSKIDTTKAPESGSFVCGFYSVNYKTHCSFLYGMQSFDHQEGSMHCTGPNQIITFDSRQEENNSEGWGLYFHPELIRNTNLGNKINEFTFFTYSQNEALHLSEHEKQTLLPLLKQLEVEYNANIDQFSQELIISNIELLLNYCKRFYSRQFITRTNQNKDIAAKFETFLSNYFNSGDLKEKGTPSVKFCADSMNLSPNYFSDLLKTVTGKNTLEHIQFYMLEKAKNLLADPELSISEIAYELGFEYSQSFSKFFKNKVGVSPTLYRAN
jgi:AraC family transcriptional activator of pobA